MKKKIKASFIIPIIVSMIFAIFFVCVGVLMILSTFGVCTAPNQNMTFNLILLNFILASPWALILCTFLSLAHKKAYRNSKFIFKYSPLIASVVCLAPPTVAFVYLIIKSLLK
ncbi:MAG: hypothetical protein RR902_03130 [Oscillospiraceae bacterium]